MEFAPQYSKQEKIRRISAAVLLLAVAVAVVELGSPVLERWLAGHRYGAVMTLYGTFVGYPLLLTLGLLAFNGRMFYRVWRERQYPPQGMKTYHPTAYVYGAKARLRAGGFFLICAFLLGIAAYGAIYLHGFVAEKHNQA